MHVPYFDDRDKASENRTKYYIKTKTDGILVIIY